MIMCYCMACCVACCAVGVVARIVCGTCVLIRSDMDRCSVSIVLFVIRVSYSLGNGPLHIVPIVKLLDHWRTVVCGIRAREKPVNRTLEYGHQCQRVVRRPSCGLCWLALLSGMKEARKRACADPC